MGSSIVKSVFCFSLLLFTCLVNAQSFINGDLEGEVDPFESSVLPDDWFLVPWTDPVCAALDVPGATPDLCNAIAPFPISGIAGYAQSGDHFVAGLHCAPALYHEGIMQEVSGFTVGDFYVVSFYQTPLITFLGADTSGSWAVYRDFDEVGVTEPSTTFIGLLDLEMDWEYRSVIFQATATSHFIKFMPQSDGLEACNDDDVDNSLCFVRMAIDNVALTHINPEPDFSFDNVCVGEEVFFENLTASTDYVEYWHWDFGDGNTSDLENPVHLFEAPGTYDVKLVAGYFDSVTYTVTVFPPPIADFEYVQETDFFTENGREYCANNKVKFTDLSSAEAPDFVTEWYWDFGDGFNAFIQHPEHVYGGDGTFTVNLEVVTNEGCRADTSKDLTISSHVVPIANFDFSVGDHYYTEVPIEFYNQSIDANSWEWYFGDGTTTNEEHPIHAYGEYGKYVITLVATNTICHDTAYKTIHIEEEVLLYVPNSFTPNGDDYNTTFKPVFVSGLDPYDYHLTIFNRWGEIIFESYNVLEGWDGSYGGEIVTDGTYLWTIEFGSINSDEKIKRQGHLTLLK